MQMALVEDQHLPHVNLYPLLCNDKEFTKYFTLSCNSYEFSFHVAYTLYASVFECLQFQLFDWTEEERHNEVSILDFTNLSNSCFPFSYAFRRSFWISIGASKPEQILTSDSLYEKGLPHFQHVHYHSLCVTPRGLLEEYLFS